MVVTSKGNADVANSDNDCIQTLGFT